MPGSVGLIPGWGAGIPHALRPKNQNIKQRQYCSKFNKDFKKNGPYQKKSLKKKNGAIQYYTLVSGFCPSFCRCALRPREVKGLIRSHPASSCWTPGLLASGLHCTTSLILPQPLPTGREAEPRSGVCVCGLPRAETAAGEGVRSHGCLRRQPHQLLPGGLLPPVRGWAAG